MTLKRYMYDQIGKMNFPILNKNRKWIFINNKYILEVQRKLVEIGFFTKVDGAFGKDTEKSIKQFQLTYGLAETGIINEIELITLKNCQDAQKDNSKLFGLLKRIINNVAGKNIYEFGKTYIVGVGMNRTRKFRTSEYDDIIYVFGENVNQRIIEFKASVDPGVDNALQIYSPQQIWYSKSWHHWKRGNECLRPIPKQKIKFTNHTPKYAAVNMHWAGSKLLVGRWSEGCQVIFGGHHGEPYTDFLKNTWGNKKQKKFLYTLVDSNYMNKLRKEN